LTFYFSSICLQLELGAHLPPPSALKRKIIIKNKKKHHHHHHHHKPKPIKKNSKTTSPENGDAVHLLTKEDSKDSVETEDPING